MGVGVFDEKSRLRNDIPGLQDTVTRRCPYATNRDRVTPEALVRSADPAKGWYGESPVDSSDLRST